MIGLELGVALQPMRLVSSLIALSLLATSALASAEDSPEPYPECTEKPTANAVNGAKGAFSAGQVSFNEGDYNRAIVYWRDAYRRDCTAHALLLNLGRAYELNSQKRHAVNALETYLARKPDAPNRDQIARRIEILNEKIAKEPKTTGTPPPNSGTTSPPSGQNSGNSNWQGNSNGNETAPGGDEGSRPILPLVVAGAGAVVAIVGGVVFLSANSEVQDWRDTEAKLQEDCIGAGKPPDKCVDVLSDEQAADANAARNRQTIGGVMAGVGGAALVGGLVWYFLSPKETSAGQAPRRPHTALRPAIGLGFTGLSLSGSF